MKKRVFIILFLAGCTAKHAEEARKLELWKSKAIHQSRVHVQEVIRQLQEDCDSSLLQAAKVRADSIMHLRTAKTKRKQ